MEIRGGIQSVEEAFATPGLDGWLASRPYEDASGGGDIHYVSVCGGGQITRLIVADVAGHGASAIATATKLRGMMHRFINSKSQTAMVRALNREFVAQSDDGRFATAIVATYLANSRRLTVCNAGHPRPLWYHAATRSWDVLSPETVKAANLPLGIDEDAPYEQFSIPLDPADALVVYTDGLTEALNPDGKLLGENGLLDRVRDLSPTTDEPEVLGQAVREAVGTYRDGHQPDDDETLLVLQHNARGPRRPSVGETFDVLAKVFRLKEF
jgi:serine phosphatase RsbU (regulator of sigma subunit)